MAVGSGFFIDGGNEGVVAVTNAHVVDSHRSVRLEWVDGVEMDACMAELIAIDYSHDLAIVRPTTQTLSRLKLAGAAHPGEHVWLCGYPHGVDTPRIATALVAGYDVYAPFGRETAAMMLDGNVNPGNSGGPVCDANEDVVGVVAALHRIPLLPGVREPRTNEERQALDEIRASFATVCGIGYALHPLHVQRMLKAPNDIPDRARAPVEKYAPSEFQMSRQDFISLQVQAGGVTDSAVSPIGVFCVDADGNYYAGWNRDRGPKLAVSPSWQAIARDITTSSTSFLLRGYDVVAYRTAKPGYRQGYWAVRVRLNIAP